jgi:hypothetical protein
MQSKISLQNVNISAAECSNGDLNQIRKSFSYMRQRNTTFLAHLSIFICGIGEESEISKKDGKREESIAVDI